MRRLPLLIALVLAVFALTNCGGEPFQSHPGSEIKAGPGAITGADGELVIYRR